MDLKRWTRFGFAFALVGSLFVGGLVLSTEPVDAAGVQCPIRTCFSTRGWSFAGGCTIINGTIEGFCCDMYVRSRFGITSTCRTNCIEL